MPPNWDGVFNGLYARKMVSPLTFQKAVLSGSVATYPISRTLPVGVQYVQAGFDFTTGVLYAEDRIEVIIWLRDWFSRTSDGATATELAQVVADLRGDVVEGSPEHWSRFQFADEDLKYNRHRFDFRPDGKVFAVVVTLQAAK